MFDPRLRKTFGMSNPRQFLAKFDWDIEQLAKLDKFDVLPYSFQTINCAVAGWSMVDWVAASLTNDEAAGVRLPNKSVRALKQYVQRSSPALAACREIADASKHKTLTDKPSPTIGTPALDVWAKADGGYKVCIPIRDGALVFDSLDLMRAARQYWFEFLEKYEI